jgi:hypothetical protein
LGEGSDAVTKGAAMSLLHSSDGMTSEDRFSVRLTESEALLLGTVESMSPVLAEVLGETAPSLELSLSLDEIDELIERLRDEVVVTGFDADYDLSGRGRILQGLADRLFARFLGSDAQER